MNASGITIATTVTDHGLIVQDMTNHLDGIRDSLVRQVIDTKEDQIRTALIKLGWTPPAEKKSGNN